MKVAVASDHAGLELKQELKEYLSEIGFESEDFGTNNAESVDYPDYAFQVAARVRDGLADRGVLVCGTGLGMCIAANKVRGVRAVQAEAPEIVRLSRQHNDANVLCLAGRFTSIERARELLKLWLETPFEGGRHQRRVDKIARLEERP